MRYLIVIAGLMLLASNMAVAYSHSAGD